jgi:tRNA(Ile)-lysidine synthase
LLITVSGGIDSVVLCELCSRLGFQFRIAHCNFQLRGSESDRDEVFVRELAKKYEVEFFVRKFETLRYAEEKKLSVQLAARELRYDWFNSIPGSDYILTAHHADDNIETLLMNFFKGTGIGGLHGILPKKGRLVRPLLFACREDIRVFAEEMGLTYVEDSSNASDKYSRNYLRHQVIPAIEKLYPNLKENLRNNIRRFSEAELLYRQAVEAQKKKLLQKKGEELHIPVLKLQKQASIQTLLYEIVKEFGFSPAQATEALHLLDSESGKYIASSTHRIIRNRSWLIISPLNDLLSGHIPIQESDKRIGWNSGQIHIEKIPVKQPLSLSRETAQLDADRIVFPLLLRKWKKGDYFYPLGMKKKKKLSRFFIDQKLSITEREDTWVIEMDKKIIWVVGWRIDDRFKITDATREMIVFKLSKK